MNEEQLELFAEMNAAIELFAAAMDLELIGNIDLTPDQVRRIDININRARVEYN